MKRVFFTLLKIFFFLTFLLFFKTRVNAALPSGCDIAITNDGGEAFISGTVYTQDPGFTSSIIAVVIGGSIDPTSVEFSSASIRDHDGSGYEFFRIPVSSLGTYPLGSYVVNIIDHTLDILGVGINRNVCTTSFEVKQDPSNSGGFIVTQSIPFCLGNSQCENCVLAHKSWTAIGCLPTGNLTDFIVWLLGKAILVAGGIALLIIVWGGFQIVTSSGDPQKVQEGKSKLTAAIVGLLFIIFSLFLLRFIGITLLNIPGLEP